MKALKTLGWIALLAGLMACGGDSKNVAGPEGNNSADQLTGEGSLAPDRVGGEEGSDGVPGDGVTPSLVIDSEIVNTADLIELLEASGIAVEQTGELVEQPFFTPDAQILKIGAEGIQVFEYETVEKVESEARQVSPSGSPIGTTMVLWMAPPRFYAVGNIIVLYVGQDETVSRALDRALGGPFAGAGISLPIDDTPVFDAAIELEPDTIAPGEPHPLPTPGSNGTVFELQNPAIVVASTASDLRQLASLIQDSVLSERLASIDIEGSVVIAVFRGERPTAGYGIEIEEVRTFEEYVEVTVSFTNPGIDELVAQMITYPVAVRIVPRDDLPEVGGVDWIAVSPEGKVVAKFRRDASGSGASVDGAPGVEPVVSEITFDPGDEDGQVDLIDPRDEGTAPPITLKDADIRGTISTFEANGAADVPAQILVEGEIESDTEFDKALVSITEQTRIVRISANDAYTEAIREELTPGTKVQVLFTGIIAESYPVQVAALHVVSVATPWCRKPLPSSSVLNSLIPLCLGSDPCREGRSVTAVMAARNCADVAPRLQATATSGGGLSTIRSVSDGR